MDYQKTKTRLATPTIYLVLCLALGYCFELSAGAPPTADNLKKAKSVLQSKNGDYNERKITRLGNNTIGMEAFAVVDADWVMLRAIISNFAAYPNWIPKNINDRPGGGKYYVQLKDMRLNSSDPNLLETHLLIHLPALNLDLERKFKLEFEGLTKEDVYTLTAEGIPSAESPVAALSAYIQFFRPSKKDSKVWIYASGTVTLRNWLLYESLPERLLNRESGDRVQILLDNYLTEENRKRTEIKK